VEAAFFSRDDGQCSECDAALESDEIQFLIATHSSILLAYPNAQILSFDDGAIHETTWEETGAYQSVARFLSRPEVYLREIFGEIPVNETTRISTLSGDRPAPRAAPEYRPKPLYTQRGSGQRQGNTPDHGG